jgi:hypothetical protein
MKKCFNDQHMATELGAYGVAFLVLGAGTTFTVIERSARGTGFDYWLGSDDSLFQRKARLEVSGILVGENSAVDKRIAEKIGQTKRSAGSLPAYAVVVEFSRPMSKVVKDA